MDPGSEGQIPPHGSVADLLARLPARSVGRFGRPGDPWNLLFLGTEAEVVAALQAAGWTLLPRTIPASLRAGLGQLLRGERLTLFPPMNEYRQFGRVQDQNWVRVTVPVLRRHHFRLWAVPQAAAGGRRAWWGSANYDMAARFWDLSHVPDPDIDAERGFIAASLRGIPGAALETAGPPGLAREGVNDKGYPFFTDGTVLVVRLGGGPAVDQAGQA
ncbi:MAG: LssY C-terminal domain-containing protein [Elusimicrobia bacterium]|nr:LssY C-terminal domain-containing protein [Elusimicrobiota bacterium]